MYNCTSTIALLQVGVGTCNVGGQPMTEYEVPKNYVRQ